MDKDKKDNFRSKLFDRYFEVEEDKPHEEMSGQTQPQQPQGPGFDEEPNNNIDVQSPFVNDEVSVVKKPTIISSETVIHGNINASNDLEVCGQIIGDILVEGMVKVLGGAVTGNIKASKIFIKDSVIDGNIVSDSMIDIIDNSEITGNVDGGDIVINCKCKGNITAGERLKLLENATIRGDLQTRIIKIEEGAIVEGTLKMLGV